MFTDNNNNATSTTLTIQKDLPMSEVKATTPTPNQQKDLPMIEIDFDYSHLAEKIELFVSDATDSDIENLEWHYDALVNCAFEDKVFQLGQLQDAFDYSRGEYCYKAEGRIEELESEISQVEELESEIDAILSSCSLSSVENYLESALSEVSNSKDQLESEKEDLEEFVEFYEETQRSLDEFKEKLLSLIKEKAQVKVEEKVKEDQVISSDLSDEIKEMTADEHRITWRGVNDQDIAHLVSKILLNRELATHLALEAIKAEKNFMPTDCPNGHFSK